MHQRFLAFHSDDFTRIFAVERHSAHADITALAINDAHYIVTLEIAFNFRNPYRQYTGRLVTADNARCPLVEVERTFGKPAAVGNPSLHARRFV